MENYKRSRLDFSTSDLEVLEDAWGRGMKRAAQSCRNLIDEVVERLQIPAERVHAWIGNRRGKDKGSASGQARKKKVTLQGPNGYSHFISKQDRGNLKGKEFLSRCAESWVSLEGGEKEKFMKEASEIRKNPTKNMDREAVVNRQLKIIGNACVILSGLGYEVGGMGFDPNSESKSALFGSARCLEYFSGKREEFEIKLGAPLQNTEQSVNRHSLRSRVRTLYQSCWEKASGQQSKIPYGKIAKGEVVVIVSGLPAHLNLKNPSDYGKAALRTILKSKVVFDIRPQDQTPTPTAVADTAPGINIFEISTPETLMHDETTLTHDETPDDQRSQEIDDTFANQIVDMLMSVHNHLEEPVELSSIATENVLQTDLKNNKEKARKRKTVARGKKHSAKKRVKAEREVYDVEEILDEKTIKKKKYVLIKWKGYPNPTWEPVDNVVSPPQV